MLKRARRDEFFFLFGYDPTYWRGLRKHGLIDDHAGVRLIQCLFTPRHRCFNQFAVPGGCLHREVWARRRPLLIDRGCGGINYEDYPFDKELMDAYAHRLGDRFLGVQLHEWDCNTANDWDRISRRWPKEKPIELPFLQEAFDWRTPATCLETGDPHDFVGRKFPQTQGDFHRDCERFFRRKFRDFHGYLTNVPAPGLSFAQPLRWGARVAMPEYGHHGPMARLHAAAARGAVKQEGRGSIGSYFAPWANSPDSVTCHTDFTLWYSPAEALCGDAFKWRGNGGCSRAFQRRLFWWSYLAGSRFLAEEWGPENTFFDWKDFDLTSYGQVVTDFLQYVRSHGRGRLVTPTAIVLDREYAGLDCVFLAGWRQKPWGFYEATPHQQALAEFFRQLIGYRNSPPNDNARVLPASAMPDAFDIVLDDASKEFLSRYAVLAYVGEHPGRFRRKMRGYTGELLMLEEPLRTAKAVTEATLARLPLRVEGPAHWLLCRKGGALQVAVFNPHGVTTDSRKGEQSDPKAAAYVTIAAPAAAGRARLIYGWPKETSIRAAKGHVDLMVGPGGLAIVELPL